MKPGGYEELNRQLFSEAASLQVTPRRRLATNVALNTVAGNNDFNITFGAPDKLLNPGDGFLFEAALLLLNTTSLSMNIESAALTVQPQGSIVIFPLGDCKSVPQSATSIGSNLVIDLLPENKLWTFLDFNSLIGAQLTTTNQPLGLRMQFTVADSNAEAVSGRAILFYRFVRGLQEG